MFKQCIHTKRLSPVLLILTCYTWTWLTHFIFVTLSARCYFFWVGGFGGEQCVFLSWITFTLLQVLLYNFFHIVTCPHLFACLSRYFLFWYFPYALCTFCMLTIKSILPSIHSDSSCRWIAFPHLQQGRPLSWSLMGGILFIFVIIS